MPPAFGAKYKQIRVRSRHLSGKIGQFVKKSIRVVPVHQKMGVVRRCSSQARDRVAGATGRHIDMTEAPRGTLHSLKPGRVAADQKQVEIE
jgi:hypothetical protein